MKITAELLNKAEALQSEMHSFIDQVKKHTPETDVTHQDMMFTCMFIKIVELEEKLKGKEDKKCYL